jgi:protein involved in polysaccharide export with SLBB domain
VAGQRFDDVKAMLEQRVTHEMFGSQASVTLGELRSMQVFLLGDVNQPGSYTVSSLSTITNVLIVGGGISRVGSLRDVRLKREGRTVEDLDLYDLLLAGDSTHDQRLLPGDVIFVPPVGPRVSVDGEVRRPAIYELKGPASVAEVLKLAGGLMASTNASAVQLTRYDRNQKKTLTQVDVTKPADLALRVQDSDFIRVRKLSGPLDNNVRVLGFVRYTGAYEWSPGYDLAQLLQAAQVLPSENGKETYLPLGLIQRTDTDTGVRGWLSFNVHEALAGGTVIPLQRDDLVVVLSRTDVEYLSSPSVRAVVGGDFSDVQSCPGLQDLATLVNSERSIRFAKAFSFEPTHGDTEQGGGQSQLLQQGQQPEQGQELQQMQDQRTSTAAGTQVGQLRQGSLVRGGLSAATMQPCPEIFRRAPQALSFLLDESAAVYGEVRRPGIYPIARDTPLKMLIEAAGGLTRESDSTDVEYVSYDKALKNGHSSYEQLDLGQVATLRMSPGDVLNFKPLYLGQEVGTVKASGEFRFPATYGILRGEKLSELMKRAGGLTDNAYSYGAIFTRRSARKAEEESYRRAASELQEAMVTAVTSGALGTNAQISSQFLSTVVDRLQNAQAVGRVVIQADPAALAAHPEMDPILEPGDAIYMPKRPVSVTVIGEVLNPGTLEYMPDFGYKQYVEPIPAGCS